MKRASSNIVTVIENSVLIMIARVVEQVRKADFLDWLYEERHTICEIHAFHIRFVLLFKSRLCYLREERPDSRIA